VRQAGQRGRAQDDPTPVRRYHSEPSLSRTLARLPWSRVLATGAVAFALVVGVFTLAELGLGESVTSDRRTTFFNSSERDKDRRTPTREEPAGTARAETTTPATTTAPETTEPTTETVATAPTETAPGETTPTGTTTP
jgi:cytoskeletal protein RodZ